MTASAWPLEVRQASCYGFQDVSFRTFKGKFFRIKGAVINSIFAVLQWSLPQTFVGFQIPIGLLQKLY